MFTGIVEEIGKVAAIKPTALTVYSARVVAGLELGASVAVNGVCLTVTSFSKDRFTVDIMPETISRSNIGQLKAGDEVNLEKAMALGGSMGGHLVQGHIDATGRISGARLEGETLIMRFNAPPSVMRYIVEKGFIAVDGASLTVMGNDEDSFQVSLVNFTRNQTVLGKRKIGDSVNLEVDIIAKYVEKFSQPRSRGVTADFLQQHGFLSN